MASFAALISLQTTIHTLQNHPNPPICLHNRQVQSLLQNVTFLQEFLELYSHRELYLAQDLDSLIKSAAYAAEDVIESYIVDRIGGSTSKRESSNYGGCFYQNLRKVVEEMDCIKRKALKIKENLGDANHESGSWTFDASPAALQSLKHHGVVVAFEDVWEDLLDKLTRNRHSSLQIIPIVGMGGIGKTTLALKAFEDRHFVADHFDLRIWVTISQKFNTHDILVEILCQSVQDSKETLSQLSEDQLRERIHKEFLGMRYLVVMDDLWSSEAWDDIKRYFPDNKNGSVMIVTTRISNLFLQLTDSSSIKLSLLDEDKSWKLFCKKVFGDYRCPLELVEIGKKIVGSCRGLPLSIVVIGGLLAKSIKTKQYWEDVARNVSATVNLVDDERCLKILYLSYRNLPIHLKPCFLYMSIFPENARIQISWLVKLLAAEGFLKPIDGMIMEDVAEEYINDLVQRNLILVDEWGSTGNVKSCKIQYFLRDLCIREAQKEDFFCDVRKHQQHSVVKRILSSVEKFLLHTRENDCWYVGNLNYESGLEAQRRIVVRERVLKDENPHQQLNALESASLVRSVIVSNFEGIPDLDLKLLRVLAGDGKHRFPSTEDAISMTQAFHFYNSRYLALSIKSEHFKLLHSSIALLWNLQTLIVSVYSDSKYVSIPIEIWKLPQLRHIYFDKWLKPPSTVDDDNFVLWNLTSLSRVYNFKSREVVKRIPNIKKLSLVYDLYAFIILEQLHQLEHLKISMECCQAVKEARRRELLPHRVKFPHSLKKLKLNSGKHHNWDEVTTMTGALHNLEKLVLERVVGTEWRLTEEGQFSKLKMLSLISCKDLKSWTIDSTPFPLLQRLTLYDLPKLKEIPSEIGEIPNIQSICVVWCTDSCVESAKRIAEEQEEHGNPNLQVSVALDRWNKDLRSLGNANFKIS